MSKTLDIYKSLVNSYGEKFAKLVEDVHIVCDWKFDEGVTGVLIETTEENRWKIIEMLETLKK